VRGLVIPRPKDKNQLEILAAVDVSTADEKGRRHADLFKYRQGFKDVICVAGSGRGADTAVVLSPVNTNDFFDLKIKEILCKPHF